MSKYESPVYQVIKKEGSYEIRSYESFKTTSVVESNLKGYSGFGLLFSYIRGNNDEKQQMSMTVPVINAFDDDEMTMEFVIPKSFQKQVPKPKDDHLKIKHYDQHFSACLTFSGTTNKKRVAYHLQMLKNWISKNNLNVVGSYGLARFNPPFSLPMFRRNEVFVHVESSTPLSN